MITKKPWWANKKIRNWFFVAVGSLLSIWVIPLIIMQFVDPKTIDDMPKLLLRLTSFIVFLISFTIMMYYNEKFKDTIMQDYNDK